MNLSEFRERFGGRPDKGLEALRAEGQAAIGAELGRLAARVEVAKLADECRAKLAKAEDAARELREQTEVADKAAASYAAENADWQRRPGHFTENLEWDTRRGRLRRLQSTAGNLLTQQVGAESTAQDLRALLAVFDAELAARPETPYLAAVMASTVG